MQSHLDAMLAEFQSGMSPAEMANYPTVLDFELTEADVDTILAIPEKFTAVDTDKYDPFTPPVWAEDLGSGFHVGPGSVASLNYTGCCSGQSVTMCFLFEESSSS